MRVIVTSIFIAAAGLASPVGAVGSGSGGNSAVAPVSARIAKAERMIKSGNHVAAVETLRVIVEDEPGNADEHGIIPGRHRLRLRAARLARLFAARH